MASPHTSIMSRHGESHRRRPRRPGSGELASGLDPRGLASGLVHQLTSKRVPAPLRRSSVGHLIGERRRLTASDLVVTISIISEISRDLRRLRCRRSRLRRPRLDLHTSRVGTLDRAPITRQHHTLLTLHLRRSDLHRGTRNRPRGLR